MGTSRRTVTARAVAQAAGVSVATVSRVMAGSDKVTAARRSHVLAVADELGYRPHSLAQGLATGTSHMVGVVVPNLSNPYFYDIIRGFGQASAADGYRMVVSDSMEDPDLEHTLIGELLRYVDALVLMAPRSDLTKVAQADVTGKPVVVMIGPQSGPLPDVSVDNFGGMTRLYQHLAELGHRRVAYLAGPPHSSQNELREAAGQEARDLGIEVRTVPAGGDIAAGHAATDAALATGASALACFNDLVAFGVLHGLAEAGIRVPDELSVTGFDDIDFSSYSSPRLTTVRTPREELGRAGWRVLSTSMAGRADGAPPSLPAELVVRESTAPPAHERVRQAGSEVIP